MLVTFKEADKITVKDNGLIISGEMSHDYFLDVFTAFSQAKGKVTWAIADMLLYARDRDDSNRPGWWHTYTEAMDITGWTYGHCANIVSTAKEFPLDRRMPWPFTITHHAAVAALPPPVADKLLQYAYVQKFNRDELRELKKLNDGAETEGDVQVKRGYTDYEQLVLPLHQAAEFVVSAWQSGKNEVIEQAMRDLELSLNESKTIHSHA